MNFYEDYAIRLQKQIKRIDADPDPVRLKSNRLLYEIILDETLERAEAWRQGRPFCDNVGWGPGLAWSMGFTSTGSVGTAFATRTPQKYIDEARAIGLPIDTSCDMSMMPFAMMECGDVPMQDFNVCEGTAPCAPMRMRSIYVSHKTNCFSYPIDVGTTSDETNYNYVLDQLRGFIEFAEKIPGIKYNEDKHAEFFEYQEAAYKYVAEIREMLKHRPAPIAGKDATRIGDPGTNVRPSAKTVELRRLQRDEIVERVEKGIAAVPGEELRVAWTMTNPVFMDVWKVLAKMKVAGYQTPQGFLHDLRPIPEFLRGKKLTPLEKAAARTMGNIDKRRSKGYIDSLLADCKTFHIDGIVHYNMLGCQVVLPIRKMLEERAEKEAGIPTLQLVGKQWDSNYVGEAQMTAQLAEFVQILRSRKGLN